MLRRGGASTALLLAPGCVLFGVFVLYPLFASVALSLYEWDGIHSRRWVGLDNYRELFADPVFHTALRNNLRWVGLYVIAPVLGLLLAMFLNQAIRGMRLVRSLFFMPYVISQVAVALIFGWFFHPRFGLLVAALEMLGLPAVSPLDSERGAIYALIVAGLWPQTAYCMILYLAGLAMLRADVIEAARLDGASGWSLFRHIVLPQLRPVNFIVALVCLVAALRSFDYVAIMTLGGPHDSSTVLAFYMYEQTFIASRYGQGAAIATVLLLLMGSAVGVMLWRLERLQRA